MIVMLHSKLKFYINKFYAEKNDVRVFKYRSVGWFSGKFIIYTISSGSVVGIATGYGFEGPGIKSRWRRDFPHLSRPALKPTKPPVK